MSRIFKHTYTTLDRKTGQRVTRETKKWYVEYRPAGAPKPVKVPGYTDKRLTEQLAAKLEREAMRISAGVMLPEELAGASQPISQAIDDYTADLTAKGRTGKHVGEVKSKLQKVVAGCKWVLTIQMNGLAAQRWLKDQMDADEFGAQTQCHYCAALRAFAGWLCDPKQGKLARDPFTGLERANPDADRRHERRSLSAFTFTRLLVSTSRSERKPYGMTGPDRAALYMLAAFSGFRSAELGSLDHGSVSFDGTPPAVRIHGDKAKNRKGAEIPLPQAIAARLSAWLATKPPGLLWPGKWADWSHAAIVLRRDLKEAGIPYTVRGRVFDFHALRGQFGSMLARAGVPLQVAQKLMRHSDPRLTSNLYTKLDLDDMAAAVEKLM